MKTNQLLKSMKIIAWVIFIGSCINAGILLFSLLISHLMGSGATENSLLSLNLTELYTYKAKYYYAFVGWIVVLMAIKSYVFYVVIKLFAAFDEHYPFSKRTAKLISDIGCLCLMAAFVATFGSGGSKWLYKKGIVASYDWSANEYLFMAGIVFIISLFVKRGVEIQSENELTI